MMQRQHGNHSKRHILIMAICCLVLLAVLGLLW